jgi:hypothetical protein
MSNGDKHSRVTEPLPLALHVTLWHARVSFALSVTSAHIVISRLYTLV